jgi:hypothetical protein
VPSCVRAARARALAPLALPLTVALAAALAGCGGSSGNGIASKSPAEILAASRAAAEGATSVHVVSRASQGRLSLTSDLELAGDRGRARVSFLGRTREVIRIGDTLYLKGYSAVYKRLGRSTDPHVPRGAWVKAPANSGRLVSLAALTNLRTELGLLLGSTVPLTKGATTAVNGQHAIELKEKTAKGFTGFLYIATTGTSYPIELVKHGAETGQITFSGWNEPVSLTAPANAVALSKLKPNGR